MVTESTLEELLEQTAQAISAAGDMPPRMKAMAKRLDQQLVAYNYVVETKRQELRKAATFFLKRWGEQEKQDAEG